MLAILYGRYNVVTWLNVPKHLAGIVATYAERLNMNCPSDNLRWIEVKTTTGGSHKLFSGRPYVVLRSVIRSAY